MKVNYSSSLINLFFHVHILQIYNELKCGSFLTSLDKFVKETTLLCLSQ